MKKKRKEKKCKNNLVCRITEERDTGSGAEKG